MDVIWEKLKALFGSDEPVEVVFKDEWIVHLVEHLPLYSRFSDELRQKVHEKIARFVATTYFEGCGGLELTDEMILSVAGQACMLIVNHEGDPYPNLKSVLLYPSTFGSKEQRVNEAGVVTSEVVYRLGESWSSGTVVLAWDSVARGARNIFDGRNVTFHEFAHQLDQEDGRADGVPFLEEPQAYHTWGEVLGNGYVKLVDRAERRKKSVMDHYGATNIAEFFAVATESFFEKPRQMNKKHPLLYQELKDYYRLDPLEWHAIGKRNRMVSRGTLN